MEPKKPTTRTAFKKGEKRPGQGRPKGCVNKNTAQLKEMILGALEQSGGVDYLVQRANDPRTASAFLTLIGKVLPMQVESGPGGLNATVTLVVAGVKPSQG